MKRYIALLRGINISGKNKIAMPALKACVTELGYTDVCTYLNSGNVVFSGEETEETVLAERIRAQIGERFRLVIPVLVLPQKQLEELLRDAPAWWGTENPEIYDNLIFILPPRTAEWAAERIGEPSEGLEQVSIRQNAIFWSFDRKQYARAHWWKKTAERGMGETMTIRTANTLNRLVAM